MEVREVLVNMIIGRGFEEWGGYRRFLGRNDYIIRYLGSWEWSTGIFWKIWLCIEF